MVCRDFILPEPASYVFFYAFSNLRKLLYIIQIVAKLIVITRAGKYSFHYDFGGQRAMPVKQRYIAFCTLNKTKGTADANHTGGISPT